MGNPLRILHVVVNMNRGGAETLLMNIYRNIDRTKIQFDFLTNKPGVFDEEIKQLGGKVHRTPYITEVGHFNYVNNLNDFFQSNRDYNIVHSHLDKMSGLVLKAAKQAGVITRISHSHNTSSEGGLLARAYKWFAGKQVMPNSTHQFACSSEASKWLFGANVKTPIIVKNGIDTNQFKFSPEYYGIVRRELKINDNVFVVGHVGRFCTQKNHLFLLEIFSEINKLNPNSLLILVGEGPLKSDIESEINKLGLKNSVKVLGVRSDVHRVIQAFDLFLFPSLHEGLPVTLIEAQAVGLPCLISEVITEEVKLGNELIHYMNLKESPRDWALKTLSIKNKKVNTINLIKRNGYDIRNTADWLSQFYLTVNKNKGIA